MCNRLEGKAAIVTGAGSGIGRAIALAFAKEGAKVLVNDVRSEDAIAVAQEIKAQGGEALALEADVSQNDQVEGMVKTALETFGAVDLLVNNAGVGGEYIGSPLSDLTEEDWDSTYQVNLGAISSPVRRSTWVVGRSCTRGCNGLRRIMHRHSMAAHKADLLLSGESVRLGEAADWKTAASRFQDHAADLRRRCG